MSNDFLLRVEELLLLDEREFFATGGAALTFDRVDGHTIGLHVEGTRAAIVGLARHIAEHHTASR